MGEKRSTVIPKAPVARILMNAGAKRVAAGAASVFTDKLEEIARKIAEDSVRIAKHAGRKTVHESDIKLAARR
ncbi:NFYB/HAP3 family transcription factor subunit [Candidatus Woesearchaeota archaeon]|nr:NFYB/HAP3 family transcription factor subunit [Candidatus Woesearchaeota archaeon]